MAVRAKLGRVRVDARRLNGQSVDLERVVSYAGQLKETEPPPILVARDRRGRIFILDGFHRMGAARRVGRREVRAWIVPYWQAERLCRRLGMRGLERGDWSYMDLDDMIECGGETYCRS
jgi:hypothetical protein